jgi:hypothetical protein
MIEIFNGVIFHQSETNHICTFYPHQPLPDDAPTEIQEKAAELWTPEFISGWIAQRTPAPPLEEAIAAKVAEIRGHYSGLSAVFEYQGHSYQTGPQDVLNLTAAYSMAKAGVRVSPSPWRTADNEMMDFLNPDFILFCEGVFLHKTALFEAMTGHLDTVRALTTVEAVQAYSISISTP